MDTYSCTCGGENPNCFKCDGTGLVRSPPPPLHPPGRPRSSAAPSRGVSSATPPRGAPLPAQSHTRRQMGGAQRAPLLEPIACPICAINFSKAIELATHLQANHLALSSVLVGKKVTAPRKVKVSPKLSPCPHCGSPVGNIEKHYNRVHAPSAQARKQARAERKALRKKKLASIQSEFREHTRRLQCVRRLNPNAVLCAMCLVIFPSVNDLRSHLGDFHGLKTEPAKTRSHRASQSLTFGHGRRDRSSSGREPPSVPVVDPYAQEVKERKMDATFGMGGTARDHGQFGSAPSHDAMDDESSP